jgi:hypothetical protein
MRQQNSLSRSILVSLGGKRYFITQQNHFGSEDVFSLKSTLNHCSHYKIENGFQFSFTCRQTSSMTNSMYVHHGWLFCEVMNQPDFDSRLDFGKFEKFTMTSSYKYEQEYLIPGQLTQIYV